MIAPTMWAPPTATDRIPTAAERQQWPPPTVPAPTAHPQWAGPVIAVNVLGVVCAPFLLLIVGMGSDACAPGSLCGRALWLPPLLVVAGVVVALDAIRMLDARVRRRRGRYLVVTGPLLLLAAYQITAAGIDGY